uniref:Amine oxidase domain-containing protein n=1 Tax=Chlamydomonas leiostraca TaxID=1034604 RepID=A0A7S0S6U3_9CHLO
MGASHNPPGIECWTLISSSAYGKANKVPQEAVPEEVHQKVAGELLDALAAALGRPGGRAALPRALYTRCQLWGAALPTNTPGVECVVDPHARVGICGDWLTGSSLQDAVRSGTTLANRIAALRGVQGPELYAHELGLRQRFAPLAAGGATAEIGGFPGLSITPRAGGSAPRAGSARPGGTSNAGRGQRGSGQQPPRPASAQAPASAQQRQQQEQRPGAAAGTGGLRKPSAPSPAAVAAAGVQK